MLLQCRSLFVGEINHLPIDTELDFSQVEYQGVCPITEPVRVVGAITVRAGVVQLSAKATFVYHGRCDRCLHPSPLSALEGRHRGLLYPEPRRRGVRCVSRCY